MVAASMDRGGRRIYDLSHTASRRGAAVSPPGERGQARRIPDDDAALLELGEGTK